MSTFRSLATTTSIANSQYRFYLVPVVLNPDGIRTAKYDSLLCAVQCGMMDYGPENVMLVAATMNASRDAAVAANSDVDAIPVNIDQNLPAAQVTTVQNHLEAKSIPAHWVNTSLTWRQVLRTLSGLFQFLQRYGTIHGYAPSLGSVSLDATYASLPASARMDLKSAALSMGYDISGVTPSSTLRQILKSMADQWARAIVLGPRAL